ncbi:MAG: hypothetical protein A2W05_08465 [Candidatus Schekmanbacteria bacterium RBG_16_38_10]|uniref:Uncharacterized protein n=1 Tax=Candidatus Schekmanbacteria bacterium RBG_16_38_10 TaxID=1817879 RepID=A0A1F7RXS1_9BACT|nr:MAG: hypothetical protein A2W05_08465 [Candidatus Schekmanbacteria bacterium RBG_16_38_10]
MDADRLIRYTVHGWFFIFSLFFHYWAIGGEFKHFDFIYVFGNDIKAILSFLTALASSPGLGLVTATIGNRSYHCLALLSNKLFGFGYPFLFKLPEKEDKGKYRRYFKAFRKKLPDFKKELYNLESSLRCLTNASRINRDDPKYTENIKKLHLLFNLALRLKCPRELSEFVLRRWNIFWLHINIISAIVLGGLFALYLRQYFEGICFWSYKFVFKRLLLELPILIYLFFAYFHLREARKEAVEIEYKWLLSRVPNLRT